VDRAVAAPRDCEAERVMRVVFTAFSRANYMQEVLASWARVRGVENTPLDFHVEPGCPHMERVIAEAALPSVTVHVNSRHLGVQANPFHAVTCGFGAFPDYSQPDDFVILAEDDITVGADTLEYFAWASERFAADPGILAVSTYRQYPRDPQQAAAVSVEQEFHGWVWGTWRDRWEQLAADWTFNYEHNGWDWRLNDYWCREQGRKVVYPHLARSQHIGQYGGAHCSPAAFEDLQSRCYLPDAPPQRYLLADG
jgi:hypothetical protein